MAKDIIFRRRRYIIKKGLQFHYVGVVFALALVASIVTGYTVFATGWTLLGERLANVYPQGRFLYVLKTTNMALLRNLLLISPFIFVLALLSSHRIAGPVYRIERSLDEIARGNLAMQIRLRKGDELWDLADTINAMAKNFNKTIVLNKELSIKIQRELESLKKLASEEPFDRTKIDSSLTSLQTGLNELNSYLNQWMTG